MNTPTPEQIKKLPQWAQQHINNLSRQVEMWKVAATRFASKQPESPFFVKEWEVPKRFISVPDRTLYVKHAGVDLRVFLPSEHDNQRLNGIELTFTPSNNSQRNVAMFPCGHAQVQLLSKENME